MFVVFRPFWCKSFFRFFVASRSIFHMHVQAEKTLEKRKKIKSKQLILFSVNMISHSIVASAIFYAVGEKALDTKSPNCHSYMTRERVSLVSHLGQNLCTKESVWTFIINSNNWYDTRKCLSAFRTFRMQRKNENKKTMWKGCKKWQCKKWALNKVDYITIFFSLFSFGDSICAWQFIFVIFCSTTAHNMSALCKNFRLNSIAHLEMR